MIISKNHRSFGSPLTTGKLLSFKIIMPRLQFVICMTILTCIHITVSQYYGRSRIHEYCNRNDDCIPHAFCREQHTCLCNQYYVPTSDKAMCTATLGLPCSNASVCATMTNSECVQGLCACKKKFILSLKNSSNCIAEPVIEGDYCQTQDECYDAMGSAYCVNERCHCYTNYHFVLGLGKCIRNRGLNHICHADYECFITGDSKELECQFGYCRYRLGNTSSTSTPTVVAVITILGLGIIQTIL